MTRSKDWWIITLTLLSMVTRTLLQSESIERDGRPICDVRGPEGQAHIHNDRRDLRLVAGSPFLAADRPHQQVTSNTQHATRNNNRIVGGGVWFYANLLCFLPS